MRPITLFLTILILSCFLVKQTNQFSFPKLDLTRFQQNLKAAGKKIIDKFSFVGWIVDKIKSFTNTKKDVTLLVTDAVDKYWNKKRFVNLDVDNIDEQEVEFTKHLQQEIDNFQDYLIKIYQIDTSDNDFIRHIKADPDRFFLNYDAYQLLKGLNADKDDIRRVDTNIPRNTVPDYEL